MPVAALGGPVLNPNFQVTTFSMVIMSGQDQASEKQQTIRVNPKAIQPLPLSRLKMPDNWKWIV